MKVQLYQDLISFNWNILFSIITVVVLVLILKHFFFEKVHNFMVEREKSIKDALENADEVNELAEKKLEDYQLKIADVSLEGKEIIREARKEAKNEAIEIIDKAGKKAEDMIAHAKEEILREQDNARREMKGEIADLAIMAARQIMEKEIEKTGQDEIIDKIIEEAGVEKWQN